jgi:hypothetical protein
MISCGENAALVARQNVARQVQYIMISCGENAALEDSQAYIMISCGENAALLRIARQNVARQVKTRDEVRAKS